MGRQITLRPVPELVVQFVPAWWTPARRRSRRTRAACSWRRRFGGSSAAVAGPTTGDLQHLSEPVAAVDLAGHSLSPPFATGFSAQSLGRRQRWGTDRKLVEYPFIDYGGALPFHLLCCGVGYRRYGRVIRLRASCKNLGQCCSGGNCLTLFRVGRPCDGCHASLLAAAAWLTGAGPTTVLLVDGNPCRHWLFGWAAAAFLLFTAQGSLRLSWA